MVTLQDVARVAGVSITTASRVLNGGVRPHVRADNERRVLEAASSLGYAVNLAAQAVVRGQGGSIAVLVRDNADAYFSYFSPIATGLLHAADEAGLVVTVGSTANDRERVLKMIASLRGHRPRAMIIAGSRAVDDGYTDEMTKALQQYEAEGGRVVLISQLGLPFDTITVEDLRAGRDLAVELHRSGYRRFAVMAGPPDLLTARHRSQGVITALKKLGVPISQRNVVHCTMSRDGGYEAAGELLDRNFDAEVVIAVHDSMAFGVLARFREASLSLPGDIAVAGFDDIPALRDVTPALTTVRLPWLEVGRLALERATAEQPEQPFSAVLPGRVIIRESTPTRNPSS